MSDQLQGTERGLPRSTGGGGGRVPGTTEQILVLARWLWWDYLRSRRFLILTGIIAIIGAIMTGVVGYFRPTDLLATPTAFYESLWGNGVTFVVVLAAIFLGGDAIAGEFQNKTGYFLMGQPIRRISVYVGKFLAAFSASFAVMLLFAAILVANGAFYFGTNALPWQLAPSFGLATLYLMAVLGFTFLFSSMFKTTTYATSLTAFLFLFGFNIIETVVTVLVGIEPWMVISYSSGIIGNVFADPYPPHVTTIPTGGGGAFTVFNPALETGIAIMVAYLIFSAVAGLFFFERKEFA